MYALSLPPLLPSHDEFVRQGEAVMNDALAEAFSGKKEPVGIRDFLRSAETPGHVCAVFFSGRSGSYFAQSFFDRERHPQVLTITPPAMESFNRNITPEFLWGFNYELSKAHLDRFISEIMRVLPLICSPQPGQPVLDELIAPAALFSKFLKAQLLFLPAGKLTFDALLKMISIAYRLSRGGDMACDQPLAYLWQAHVPDPNTKRWIFQNLPSAKLLTIMRFPEKSFDSHLLQHAFDNILRPRHLLARALFFGQMTIGNEAVGADPLRERFIRFEDLHHHTERVLTAWCDWLGVPFIPELTQNSGAMMVFGKKVTGARRLTRSEFQCQLLNHFDRLKVRYLMQEEYRAWGYYAYCEPDFERSIAEYEKNPIARDIPFAASAVLGLLEEALPQDLLIEAQHLRSLFEKERARRNAGITLLKPLYDLQDFPLPEPAP